MIIIDLLVHVLVCLVMIPLLLFISNESPLTPIENVALS